MKYNSKADSGLTWACGHVAMVAAESIPICHIANTDHGFLLIESIVGQQMSAAVTGNMIRLALNIWSCWAESKLGKICNARYGTTQAIWLER